MKILLVFIIVHIVYSQKFDIAPVEGLSFENLQTSDSKIEAGGADLSNIVSFENALLETKSSLSNDSVSQMLSLTANAGENLPRLWFEIANTKIKLIDRTKPVHERLELLNEAVRFLEKAADADI